MKKIFVIGVLLSSLLLGEIPRVKNNNSIGVEINPLSLTLLNSSNRNKGFSGAISHFDNTNTRELALSINYIKTEDNLLDVGYNYYDSPTEVMNISLHYRKFVSNKTNGFYYGGFGSFTYLDGKVKNDNRLATVKKFGLGAEIGVRLMKTHSNWSFYWGPALRLGTYLGSNNDVFESDSLGMGIYDKDLFVDVDFFRIGFRF